MDVTRFADGAVKAHPLRALDVPPDWLVFIRVGKYCAVRMGDPYAHKREREFWRNPEKWRTLEANGALTLREPEFLYSIWDRLQRAQTWTLSPGERVLAYVIWLAVFLALIFFYLH